MIRLLPRILAVTSLFALLQLAAYAQDIKWNSAPRRGFVFQINNKEAQKLLTRNSPDTIFNGLLHTQVDTFDVTKGWTNRPAKGHFILASIVENKLHCEYTSVFPYQVFLLKEYDALSIQVLDLDGNVREDAVVKFKLRRLDIDPESKTYRIENELFNNDSKIVTVELDGFRSIFNVEKHKVPSWYGDYNTDDGPSFYSYLITDKNKYKPNENVRFKSYALSQSRTPLHKELEVWVSNGGNSRKVGKVQPHRPGSYAGAFVLHDSLKLTLDKNYNLQLRDKNGRIVSSCNFNYEDYQLKGNKLEVHLTTDKQFHPAKNELSIVATDVNGLVLKDARASIVVRTQAIRETFQPVTILKDTLLFTKIDLDPNGSTSVDIPSALFQKANVVYEVTVTVLDSQNELTERTVAATHFYSQYELTSRFSNDSIIYELLKNGTSVGNAPFRLRHNSDGKETEVFLPHKEKLNPAISTITLRGDLVSRVISMRSLIPQLELKGGIENDSFNIQLQNPQKLDVSWYIYQGDELLQKGFGSEMEFKSIILNRSQTYYVELLYSFGGEDRIKRKDYEFREGYLKVSLDVPDRAFPGQQTDATINVVDQLGHPVNGVDLTALAVTGKLNYYLPDLPYYGKSSTPRSKKANYSKTDINKRSATLDLDYKKWEKRAGLDTMKYYQFTYPQSKMFRHTLGIADSTQFAPYVMQSGEAKQVYVVEVDRVPVYYSWVDQPGKYSFYVTPKGKVAVTLRLYDRVLVFDSLSFLPGKKTILSVDLDHLPETIKVVKIDLPRKKYRRQKVYPSFTVTEITRHLPYLSFFKHADGLRYLESGREFIPLFNPQSKKYQGSILVGPVVPGKKTFAGLTALRTTYQHTGGYTYAFEDNIVYKLNADKLIPERLYNASFKPMTNVNDLAMTKKLFLESNDADTRWHPRSINLLDRSLFVSVLLPEEKEASGFAAILFENCSTKQIISPCQSWDDSKTAFNTIPVGCHNVIAIYNNGTYLKMDSVSLTRFSKVVIDLNQSPLHSDDSLSMKWLEAASKKCYPTPEPRKISMRHSSSNYGNIKGTVYATEDNTPLPGVNIIIKGTIDGTISEEDGRFVIDSNEPVVTLVVSFIGFKTEEVEVQVGSDITVYLSTDVQQLQEVVVTGYGVEREVYSVGYSVLSGRVSGLQVAPPDKDKAEEVDKERKEKQEGEKQLYAELLTLNTIRSHFNDVGFWEPRLFTDKQGQSKFKITFPDDITRWETTVYAMNRHLQTGTARKSIKSYKPIIAELLVPPFLTQGDSAFFIGKVSNYTQDQNITGKVRWTGSRTDFEKEIQFTEFHVDKLLVNAVTTDSVTARYTFNRNDGYMDGEERKVPVVEQGIIRADGTLSVLRNKEKIQVKASAKENVTVELLSNPIDIYAGEARYLLNYKYDCNEQLASKLLGLINYRLLMQYEEKPFKHDNDINKIIARLLKNQNQEFLWSWWDVAPGTSYWMSSHILRALKAASDAGYKVNLNIENIARKAEYKFDILHQYSLSDIDLLNALASWNAPLNYPKHVEELDSVLVRTQMKTIVNNKHYSYPYSLLKEKLLLQEIRQTMHLPFQRDSVLRYQKAGVLGDVHFSDDKPANYWYDDELAANVVAYRIAKKDSLLKPMVEPMQLYFLSERNKGGWNTYHSSNVTMSILPDLLAGGASKKHDATITLTGKVNATIVKFPYRLELLPREELGVRKESGLPVYFMQYKKERVTAAKTGVEGFEIKTTLGNNLAKLEAGKPVPLTVEVYVKKEANLEYVMIEVPIPGSCSYADKTQNTNRVETHREYFKDRTVIFCENMKSGKYTFVIQLLPRFTGKFNINPAEVSLMYVPVVNANTDMKSVKVE